VTLLQITFQKTTKRSGKEFERFARIPRDQLLDMLFALFAEKSSWAFKDLRTRTEQPAEYLKEVLTMIAFLHRSGELNGQYTLLENYQDQDNQKSVRVSCGSERSLMPSQISVKFEGIENTTPGDLPPAMPDEDEDEDMEEVG
jgi:transcription initiation factor TFIIF subunit beta